MLLLYMSAYGFRPTFIVACCVSATLMWLYSVFFMKVCTLFRHTAVPIHLVTCPSTLTLTSFGKKSCDEISAQILHYLYTLK